MRLTLTLAYSFSSVRRQLSVGSTRSPEPPREPSPVHFSARHILTMYGRRLRGRAWTLKSHQQAGSPFLGFRFLPLKRTLKGVHLGAKCVQANWAMLKPSAPKKNLQASGVSNSAYLSTRV